VFHDIPLSRTSIQHFHLPPSVDGSRGRILRSIALARRWRQRLFRGLPIERGVPRRCAH
jgi:hypothetical protein